MSCGGSSRSHSYSEVRMRARNHHRRTPPPASLRKPNPHAQNRRQPIGAKVVAVRIVTQDGKVLSDAPANVTVQTGKPLDPNQVAESIRKLYRTGDYADLKVTVTPVEGGVRIDFVVREQLFFNQVLIRGLGVAAVGGFGGSRDATHARATVSSRRGGRGRGAIDRSTARRRPVRGGSQGGNGAASQTLTRWTSSST